MRAVELNYSKTKVDKAGEVVKNIGGSTEFEKLDKAMEVLSNWRAYHAMPLDTFAKVLKTRSKEVVGKDNFLVAQRLKRTPSIILKLNKHNTMRLSSLQDIGGLRVVFDNVDDGYKLVEKYRLSRSKHELVKIDDFVKEPKGDGYRSIHIIYRLKKQPKIFIEIQVRSKMQHIWATGVEVFGTLKNSSFKSGYGEKKWLEFFSYLSSFLAWREKCKTLQSHEHLKYSDIRAKVKHFLVELQVVDQLRAYTAVYSAESERVRGRKGGYNILILNSSSRMVRVLSFKSDSFEEATETYKNLEKKYLNNDLLNVVLVNTGDVKKLNKNYPNYFMDTKELIKILSTILKS